MYSHHKTISRDNGASDEFFTRVLLCSKSNEHSKNRLFFTLFSNVPNTYFSQFDFFPELNHIVSLLESEIKDMLYLHCCLKLRKKSIPEV